MLQVIMMGIVYRVVWYLIIAHVIKAPSLIRLLDFNKDYNPLNITLKVLINFNL